MLQTMIAVRDFIGRELQYSLGKWDFGTLRSIIGDDNIVLKVLNLGGC